MPVESNLGQDPDTEEQARIHRRATEVFLAALSRDHAHRAAYLDAVCGNDHAVRDEVETLLAHDRDSDIASTTGPRRMLEQLAALIKPGIRKKG